MKVLICNDKVIAELPDTVDSVETALHHIGYNVNDERSCKIGYARGIKCFCQQVTAAGTVYYFDRWHTWVGKVIPV